MAENKQPIGTLAAHNVTIGRTISWTMVDVNARYAARTIHNKSKRERNAADREAELEKLEGHIEVDESCFGGHRKGKRGRGAGGKISVSGLLKRRGEVQVILPKRCDSKHLLGAIQDNVELDSIVYSDGWKVDNRLSLNGFHHKRINHDKTLVNGKVHINGIENYWGYAKRRLKAYHGGFKRNFGLFIRERSFRFNHRDDETCLDYLQDTLLNWSDQVR